jgi:type II secretory pathway pseudopilin PulG
MVGQLTLHFKGTTDGSETEFDWQVQLYSFDLAVSNVFFFWLKEGGLENLGSVEVEAMSSAYFNITDEPLPSSSPSIPSTSTSPPSSTTASASSTITSLSTTSSGEHQKGTTSSTPAPSELENSGLNLPVAAQAGIGVGVSIVGLTATVCGILWFRYVRKQQRMLLELQQQQRVYSQPLDDVEMLKSQTPPLPPPPPFRYHSNATGRSTPVELG